VRAAQISPATVAGDREKIPQLRMKIRKFVGEDGLGATR